MDKNNESAVNKFLDEIEIKEDKNPFEPNLEDSFNKEVKEVKEEEKKEEKPLPFNKDPKIQKYIQKEISKHLDELKDNREEQPIQKREQEDDYYTRLIGNDTPEKVAMIKEALAREERMLQTAEERAFNRLSQKEQEAIKADAEAMNELETAFENIEESYGIDITSKTQNATKIRQEFISFVEKIAPKDSRGDIVDYPDMQSAWETFSEIKKATQQPSRNKELASRSMNRSTEVSIQPQERVGWNTADAFIESLGK